jgi:uncharacterized OB-fold protein
MHIPKPIKKWWKNYMREVARQEKIARAYKKKFGYNYPGYDCRRDGHCFIPQSGNCTMCGKSKY